MNEDATRIAVLGTLAEFHEEPISYDLQALVKLVTDIQPDLLCLDMDPAQWKRQDFANLPPEYRSALLPLANQTDIVVVPIGNASSGEHETLNRSNWLIDLVRAGLSGIQKSASGPDGVNHGWRHGLANGLYSLLAFLTGRQTVQEQAAHVEALTQRILEVSRDNQGSRVLVVVNVQFCHHIRPWLRSMRDVQEVRYTDL